MHTHTHTQQVCLSSDLEESRMMSHIEQTCQSVQAGKETSKHGPELRWCSGRLHALGKKEGEGSRSAASQLC